MSKGLSFSKSLRKNGKKGLFFLGLKAFFFGALFAALALFIAFIIYAKDLPRPEKFTEKQSIQSTKIYDRTGEILLYEIYGEEKRTIVPLDKISDYLKQAVIAVEDKNFYKHFGIDLEGIARAILINLRIQRTTYGGGNITPPLKNSTFFFS